MPTWCELHPVCSLNRRFDSGYAWGCDFGLPFASRPMADLRAATSSGVKMGSSLMMTVSPFSGLPSRPNLAPCPARVRLGFRKITRALSVDSLRSLARAFVADHGTPDLVRRPMTLSRSASSFVFMPSSTTSPHIALRTSTSAAHWTRCDLPFWPLQAIS
ncbi:hypothetical protein SMICM304S_00914 [Streptomyces microflavus]